MKPFNGMMEAVEPLREEGRMKYAQIRLETLAGVKFLSPFVYRAKDGIERMTKLGWLDCSRVKKDRLSLVEINHFPSSVLWKAKFADESTQRLLNRIQKAEAHWVAWKAIGKQIEKHERKGGI